VVEKLKGWRTIVFNVIVGLLPLLIDLTGYLSGFGWSIIFSDPQIAALWGAAMTLGNIVLRFLTSTDIFKKE